MDALRFELLDLLRGVAVVSLLLPRVLLVYIVAGAAFKVLAPRFALVFIFLVSTQSIQIPSSSTVAASAAGGGSTTYDRCQTPVPLPFHVCLLAAK